MKTVCMMFVLICLTRLYVYYKKQLLNIIILSFMFSELAIYRNFNA